MRYYKNLKEQILYDNSKEFDLKTGLKNIKAWNRSTVAYYKHLDKIASRVSPEAYKFFRFGYGDTGLHDAFLLSFSFGDHLDSTNNNVSPLRFSSTKSNAQMRLLTYNKDLLHTFTYKTIHKLTIDIPSSAPLFFHAGKTLGEVYAYELTAVNSKLLQLEWLLDSGGTISIQFEELVYKQKRVYGSKQPRHKRAARG
jgi:hypothetical protein